MEGSKAFQQISTFLLQIGTFNTGACKNINTKIIQFIYEMTNLLMCVG